MSASVFLGAAGASASEPREVGAVAQLTQASKSAAPAPAQTGGAASTGAPASTASTASTPSSPSALPPTKSGDEPLPPPPPPPSFREAPTPLVWRDDWPRFRTWEYVVTGVAALGAFSSLAVPAPTTKWRTISAFDERARTALRFPDQDDRDVAKDASDLLLTMLVNQLFVDTLIVTWWWRGQGSIAWEINFINLEAIALNGAVQGLTSVLAGRERPYFGGCAGPVDEQTRDCRGSKRYHSFFSGHTSTSFVAASLMCSHHIAMPLYGGGAAEAWIMCLGGFGSAATVGALRVMSDQHYMSDVLTGAAIGTLFGLGVPWLLHYRGGAPTGERSQKPPAVSLQFTPTLGGGNVVGSF